jgi:hypothetical protein
MSTYIQIRRDPKIQIYIAVIYVAMSPIDSVLSVSVKVI